MSVIQGGLYMPGTFGPFLHAGTPDGTTLAGVAPTGAMLVDTSNGMLYSNMGTQAAPNWRPQGVFANAGAPDGTTLAGVAPVGALLVDTTSGTVYVNTGTQAAPTWTVVGTQA